jgi:predicted nucleic acid-binding protein
LRAYLGDYVQLTTSRIAVVEVTRAARIAAPRVETFARVRRLFDLVDLIDVGDTLLQSASRLASVELRTLDAIHLASADLAGPDEMVAYDKRLREAAEGAGLTVASPGA